MREALERFLATCTSNLISLIGTGITTASAFLFVLLLLMHLVGEQEGGPYAGILTFLILPGDLRARAPPHPDRDLPRAESTPGGPSREARHEAAGVRGPRLQQALDPQGRPHLPGRHRGERAHPGHRHLQGCRGDGVDRLLRHRLPHGHGARAHDLPALAPRPRQVRGVPHRRRAPTGSSSPSSRAPGSWCRWPSTCTRGPSRPPSTTSAPPARPARSATGRRSSSGDRFKVNTHFEEDEANTEIKTVLVLQGGGPAGGPQPRHPLARGPGPRRPLPRGREAADDVRGRDDRRRRPDHGSGRGPRRDSPEAADAPWRTMDCVDCHNRPTHVYRMPAQELDAALLDGRIDSTLPFIRREAPEGAGGRVPEPRGGARGDREGHRRLLRVRAPRDRAQPRRGGGRRRKGRRRHLLPGTSSPR